MLVMAQSFTKSRRLSSLIIRLLPRQFCCPVNGRPNARVGAASTDIPVLTIDVFVAWRGPPLKHRCDRHDLAALAVPTLCNIGFAPGLLDRVRCIVREALDRSDSMSGYGFDRSNASTACLAVNVDGAGAALSGPAAVLRTG